MPASKFKPGVGKTLDSAAKNAYAVATKEGGKPPFVVERIELDSMFASHFMRLDPTPPWEPGNVTLVGDAIHAMLPTMGMGGNTSLRDAKALCTSSSLVPRATMRP